MSRSSHGPSEPVYYIEDCRISDRKTGLHDLDFQSDNDGTDPDVRKFSANREELTYDNLTKKIREIYNDTIEECFSVQYLDQEGDKVTFRSTEELNNALNDQVKLLAEVFYYVNYVNLNYSVKNSTVDCKYLLFVQ